jgi:hypothetical protein
MFLDTDNLKQAKQFMNKKSFNKMKEILNG